jgi:hypothetical protein
MLGLDFLYLFIREGRGFAARNLFGIAWALGSCKKSFAACGGRIFF